LRGKVVLVTRSADRAGELSNRLRELGADPIEAPTIRIEPADQEALERAVREGGEGGFDWVVYTSAAGVEAWMERARAIGARHPPSVKLAAVGEGTAAVLEGIGIPPELVPESFTTRALAEAFPEGPGRVLLARADIASDELDDALRQKGWEVVRVDAYRNVPTESLPEEARRALDEGRVDALTFTSASTVEGFVRLAGRVDGPIVVCIGPVTAEAARNAGFPVHRVAEPHTIDGLVTALEEAFR
jgi:uroporphyrinogen III methyltransferase/synthase